MRAKSDGAQMKKEGGFSARIKHAFFFVLGVLHLPLPLTSNAADRVKTLFAPSNETGQSVMRADSPTSPRALYYLLDWGRCHSTVELAPRNVHTLCINAW